MQKQERTVIHFQKGDQHLYFGNLKALFDTIGETEIGNSYAYLRNLFVKSTNFKTRTGCIIRKGTIIPSSRKYKK